MKVLYEIIKTELNEDLISFSILSGGSINRVYKCSSEHRQFVIKLNDAREYPLMFEKEERGLALLNLSNFRIPTVLNKGTNQNISYLMLEHIDDNGNTINEIELGTKLAEMHRITSDLFGLDHDNYIGAIPQINNRKADWSSFYQSMRLEPLVKKGFDIGCIETKTLRLFDKFYKELDNLIPVEPPSLLHGDLWQGNIICDENSSPVLIDPAVYYGHREIDLGMLLLFGDISQETIEAYNNIYPLDKHWHTRVDLHQMYPLLVHLILFGGSYYETVLNTLKKYA
ncbi:MAG: fructosamine kinase family protein [Crocinitomicaceae bacterium]|nr:fructosamine kinase family protein [Crocinitomicaceae bacterium]